ncbi:phytanoyl-CoA dioxygenase family protein [Phenylobacterium sp.]|uniref:phytanoyl-CoA dioxygenase family protein n=1 Tax=Phenylobacterium sp. TaxID=1871053 RepID=UPI0025FF534E|nr:phytanoyl-CoA dioxygenase family protein [Phenylobacterium sp.]MBX3484331.1 phytanoyl-CoA dioxygenase family protein [Phenylobacterium sp.]MCW5760933.1 phytanoyl-CoA dioxygenase family protein [Phenylobacterium sp.]
MAAQVSAEPRLHPLNKDFVWQDAPRTGLRTLSAGQVDQFNEDGFFVYRGAFTPDEIAAVTAAIDPLEKAHEDFVREEQGGRFRLTDSGTITFTAHIVGKSPVLQDFARHPVIKGICHDLIGDDVRLYWDQSVYKKTEKVQEFPWHQDNGYTFIEPQQYLTLWIPLVDVDEENGCAWIAPKLHKLGTLDHWLSDIGKVCLTDVEDAVAAPARAGDIVVFSSLAPHRTGPNLKRDTVRKAYILQYASDGSRTTLPDGQVIPQTDPVRQFKILEGGR